MGGVSAVSFLNGKIFLTHRYRDEAETEIADGNVDRVEAREHDHDAVLSRRQMRLRERAAVERNLSADRSAEHLDRRERPREREPLQDELVEQSEAEIEHEVEDQPRLWVVEVSQEARQERFFVGLRRQQPVRNARPRLIRRSRCFRSVHRRCTSRSAPSGGCRERGGVVFRREVRHGDRRVQVMRRLCRRRRRVVQERGTRRIGVGRVNLGRTERTDERGMHSERGAAACAAVLIERPRRERPRRRDRLDQAGVWCGGRCWRLERHVQTRGSRCATGTRCLVPALERRHVELSRRLADGRIRPLLCCR